MLHLLFIFCNILYLFDVIVISCVCVFYLLTFFISDLSFFYYHICLILSAIHFSYIISKN